MIIAMHARRFPILSIILIVMSFPLANALGWVACASSSQNEGTRAELAIDSDDTTRWSSAFSDSEWIEIDLGAVTNICGLSLDWESAYGRAYDVQLSDNAKDWRTVVEVKNGDGDFDELYFGSQTCRFVRVQGRQRGTSWGYSLWEINVRDGAQALTVTSSSGATDGLFDGKTNTGWRCDPMDSSPWLQVASAAGIFSVSVDILWTPTSPEWFVLETSDDGTQWNPVYEHSTVDTGWMSCPVRLTGSKMFRLRYRPSEGKVVSVSELVFKNWDEVPRGGGLDLFHGIVGAEGYEWVTFVGNDGTFAPEPQPYQVSGWLSIDGSLHAPEWASPQWSLREGRLPISEVRWRAGSVDVLQTTFACYVEELGRLLTFSRIELVNEGREAAEGALHALIRANPLAAKWNRKLETLQYDGYHTVSVNGEPALFLQEKPTVGAAGERALSEVMHVEPLTGERPVSIDAKRCGGVLSYPVHLPPGAKSVFTFIALAGENKNVDSASVLAQDFDKNLDGTEAYWKNRAPMKLLLPDTRYADAFYSSIYYLLMMMKGSRLYPGPYNYKSWFLHDAVEMNAALDNVGLHETARKVTEHFHFQDGGGYLDELGGSVYALYEHARLARDPDFLKTVYPRMIDGCRKIQTLRHGQMTPEFQKTPFYGLLPKSVSQDNFTIPAYLYVDDWWSILALKATAEAAAGLGLADDEKWLREEYESLLQNTLDSIRQVMREENLSAMPAFADYWPPEKRTVDAEHRILGDTQMAWAHRAALFPGRTLGVPAPQDLFHQSYSNYWKRAGGFSKGDGGWYVEYEKLFWGYNVQLAIPMMYLGMNEVTLKNIEWSLNHMACPGGWAEGYVTCEDEQGGRRVGPGPIIGDVPHGWTAAYYILLLRNMLMREEQESLILLPCVPPTWIGAGREVAVENAPTYFGPISWSLKGTGEKELTLTITSTNPPPRGYFLQLPDSYSIQTATGPDGVELKIHQGRIEIPAACRQAVVTYR